MVFKGLTDENGNIIPIQGAGTVYDDEKNSLALGSETSAIGQDQFVFGRRNVEDNNKVEIVGGGTDTTITRTETTTADILDLIEDLPINSQVTVTASKLSGPHTYKKVGNTKSELLAWFAINNIAITSLTITGLNDSDVFAYLLGDYPYVVSREEYRYIQNLKIVKTDGTLYTCGSTISRDGSSYTVGDIDFLGNLTLASIEVTVETNSNIRTLDWSGNQWNAGDITCDDGNGNTISMRGLLSRIAILEAAAQINP